MRASRPGRSRGQILPLFAISLVVLMAMGALLLDGAQALTVRRRLQDAADAASLAAANVIQAGSVRGCSATAGSPPGAPRTEVVTAAKASVATNLPWYPQANVAVTCPDGWQNYAVKVNLATTSPTFLGGVIGQTNMNVGAAGTAMNGQLASVKYSVVILDPSTYNRTWTKENGCPAVLFSGGPTVIFDGSLQIDSACPVSSGGALGANGNAATVTFPSGAVTRIVGGYSPSLLNISPTPLTGQPYVKDPLLGLPAIDKTLLTARGASKTIINGGPPTVLDPGVYSGGIQLKGQSKVLLKPGVYYLDGGGLDLGAQSSLFSVAPGVTSTSDSTWSTDCPAATCGVLIYNTGTSSTLSPISVGGGATIELRPYNPNAGPAVANGNEYLNLLIWQSASPVPSSSYVQPDVELNGGGTVNVSGTVYAPSARVYMTGGSGGSGGSDLDVTLQFISWDLQIQGNSSFHFYYQNDQFAKPTDYGLIE